MSDPTNEDNNAVSMGLRIGIAASAIGSRSDAAKSMGVSHDALQRYIRGASKPSFITISRLSRASSKSMDWIASGDKQPPVTEVTKSIVRLLDGVAVNRAQCILDDAGIIIRMGATTNASESLRQYLNEGAA